MCPARNICGVHTLLSFACNAAVQASDTVRYEITLINFGSTFCTYDLLKRWFPVRTAHSQHSDVCAFSFPEAALLLVSTKKCDLWAGRKNLIGWEYETNTLRMLRCWPFSPLGMRMMFVSLTRWNASQCYRYEPHTISLRNSKFFSNSFFDFYSYKIVFVSDIRKNDTWINIKLCILNGG